MGLFGKLFSQSLFSPSASRRTLQTHQTVPVTNTDGGDPGKLIPRKILFSLLDDNDDDNGDCNGDDNGDGIHSGDDRDYQHWNHGLQMLFLRNSLFSDC